MSRDYEHPGLWHKTFKIGRAVYNAIDCNRWKPNGNVLRLNPPHTEIDEHYRQFRKDLIKLQKQKILIKDGTKFKPNPERAHDTWYRTPLRGSLGYHFTLQDITYSKWVMKNHKDLFLKMSNWNDLEKMVRMFKRARVKKPRLTAQLIAAAWRHSADKPVAVEFQTKKRSR